jgi:hypothetical protein
VGTTACDIYPKTDLILKAAFPRIFKNSIAQIVEKPDYPPSDPPSGFSHLHFPLIRLCFILLLHSGWTGI